MSRYYRLIFVAAVACTGLTACNTKNNAVMAAQVPDEFLVLARAPLVVPPDYGLRPPSPGEPRPQDLNPEANARIALVGQRNTVANTGSAGERALMMAAKADQADPRIKEVIDDEQGDLAHKQQGFSNWVMFWDKNKPETQTRPTSGQGSTLNSETEAKRLSDLTAGQPVIIQRAAPVQESRGFKLPGL